MRPLLADPAGTEHGADDLVVMLVDDLRGMRSASPESGLIVVLNAGVDRDITIPGLAGQRWEL